MRQSMETIQPTSVAVKDRPDDARLGDTHLRERLLRMAATRSRVVRNGRFFFSRDLNALTYWYEDHTQSTRMVYIEAGG